MIRKFTSMLAAFALAAAALSPAAADARDRRGYYDRGDHHGYYGRRHHDHDDEVAAGVLGLVLGLAIGAAASQPRDRCGDGYRCAPPPPPRCYDPCERRDGYYDQGYDPRYDQDPYYDDDARTQYERDYGVAPSGYYDEPRQCTQQMRRWDRAAGRYVIVNVPC